VNHTPVKAIYAIRHKESGNFCEFNNKTCWMNKGAAKSSYRAASSRWDMVNRKCVYHTFDEQSEFEIVELLEPFFRLEGLEK